MKYSTYIVIAISVIISLLLLNKGLEWMEVKNILPVVIKTKWLLFKTKLLWWMF